jgi:hypothetical protein
VPPSWPIVLAGVLGLVLVFAAVIVIGLKARASRIARRLREVTADTAWRQLVDRDPALAGVVPRDGLLYGVWVDFSATRVGMVVKNARDEAVGRIEYRTLATSLQSEGQDYRVESSGIPAARAVLLRDGDLAAAAPVCELECTWGLLGLPPRVARYRAPGFEAEVSVGYSNPFRYSALPVRSDGKTIGALWQLGSAQLNDGRAVALPPDAPLPVRLFVLAWGAGGRAR